MWCFAQTQGCKYQLVPCLQCARSAVCLKRWILVQAKQPLVPCFEVARSGMHQAVGARSREASQRMPCLGVIVLPLTSPSHSVKQSLTQPTQTCRVLSDLPALLLAPHTHSVTHSLISVNSYMSSFVGFFTILETTSGRNTNDSCTVTAIPGLS